MPGWRERLPGVDTEQVLLTGRLALEPLAARHASLLWPLWQDPGVFRYIPDDPPLSLEWLEQRYRRLESRSSADGSEAWLQWALRRQADGAWIGRVEATVRADRPSAVAWLLGSAHWRAGYATEAMTRVLDHLRDDFGVASVVVQVDERNRASLELARRLGFEPLRRVPDADWFKGETSHELHLRLDLAAHCGT